jgi:hypothetical protein
MRLLPKPEGLLSGVVFFADEADVLALVADVRAGVDARAIEFFDNESLNFLREKYPAIPSCSVAARVLRTRDEPRDRRIRARSVDDIAGASPRRR